MAGMNGINAYQQTAQVWNQSTNKTKESGKATETPKTQSKSDSNMKTSIWKPIESQSLIPTKRDGIGMAIGDVQLSDKAKDYYSKLKAKFGNMEFIAVGSDMKERVKANAASYGNANKMVVLIDDAKLEQMANDEAFRKKYEGIIAMSSAKLTEAKNSLTASGAGVKNFGMSVNSDGTGSFFATVEKASADQTKRIEKKQAEKKAAKAKEKKLAEKKAQEKRLEKAKEEKKAEKAEMAKKTDSVDEEEMIAGDEKEYVKIEANSMEDLVNKISQYAYDRSANSVMTDAEKNVGQHFDFKG